MNTQDTDTSGSIEDVASGQRLVIFAILANIIGAILSRTADPIWGLVLIASGVVAIVGLLRLSKGLGYSTGKKVLLVIAAFIPLVSLIMLVMVNQRANEALKNAGYKVGLLGAKRT